MHVLSITPGFPENENDTDCIPPMQEYFRYLINNYSEIKSTVISIHYPFRKCIYEWNNIKVYNCGAGRASQPIRLLYWVRAILYALKINRTSKIDFIHSFWLTESALVATIVSKFLRVSHICTIMGQDAKEDNKYLKILPIDKIIKVTLSENQSKYFKEATGLNPDEIIPWGIDNNVSGRNERIFDIIGVGALIGVKNYNLFIDIIKEIKNEFPLIRCLIIGDGEDKNCLNEKIRESKLCDNIALTGHIKREEVLNIMTKSKILLHPADYEAFGYVIAEALACGCYVVSRDVGCAKETRKLFMADSKMDFISVICNLVKAGNDFEPEIIYPISQTVSSYSRLYEKLIRRV